MASRAQLNSLRQVLPDVGEVKRRHTASMQSFGDRLRAARIAMGLTQDELAARIDVTKAAVSAWENGRDLPAFGKLPLLSDRLRVSLDVLVCGAADMRQPAAVAHRVRDGGSGSYAPAPAEQLSRDELRMLRRFRATTERKRKALIALIDDDGA